MTALSRLAADEFWNQLGVEARVIHPGVDMRAFSPGGERAEHPTFFCGADIAEPRKRVPLLVEAFRVVRRTHPDARLVLSRPRKEVDAQPFAAEPGVELANVDDREVLAEAYRDAWVSVLPSTAEAFGLVLAEAMACGRPVVATDVGGMREVVDRDTVGRLFGGDRPEDLARALLEALELSGDPATVQACRTRAEDFSVDRCVAQHLELYGELLGRPVESSRRAASRPSLTA